MSGKLSESHIVEALAKSECERITRNVIAHLRGVKESLSGDESSLENTWDEI